jgi:hypothetical protein
MPPKRARRAQVHVTLTPCDTVLAKARGQLRTVERELAADWRYHDWPQEAVATIRRLAKSLRAIVGPDAPATEAP